MLSAGTHQGSWRLKTQSPQHSTPQFILNSQPLSSLDVSTNFLLLSPYKLSLNDTLSSRVISANAAPGARRGSDSDTEDSRPARRPPQAPAMFRNLDKLRQGGGRVRNDIEVIGYVQPGESTAPPEGVDDSENDGTKSLAERYGLDDAVDEDDDGEGEEEDEDYEEDEDEEDEDDDDDDDDDRLAEPEPETQEQALLRRMYTTPGRVVPRHIGPVEVAMVKDKGRGLVTTSAVAAGELLLVCEPLAVLFCDEGDTPENEELADYMFERVFLTAPQAKVLGLLSKVEAGEGGKGGRMVSGKLGKISMDDFNAAVSSEAGKGANALPTSKVQIPREELYQIVNANCIGEEFQDITTYALRSEDTSGNIGLYLEASMINHSCSPNSTHYVIGDRLLVRATEDILKGEEVTLNWVGSELTQPLQLRRRELKSKLGFECACPRCKAEFRYAGTELEEKMIETAEFCRELSPFVDTAIQQEDLPELQDIRTDLETRKNELEAAMRASKVTTKARKWMQASVYDLYDLISLCADEGAELESQVAKNSRKGKKGGGGAKDLQLDTESLAVCARLVEAVAKGSDAHLFLSAELMVRTAGRFGTQHEEAKQATRMCHESFRARYGPISEQLLDEMIEARLNV